MRSWKAVLYAMIAGGCEAASGSGTLVVEASGEQAAEVGWPFESVRFADDWRLRVDRAVVGLANIELASRDGSRVALEAEPVVLDLHHGIREVWSFPGIAARRWDRVSYRLAAPSPASRVVPPVPEEVVIRMADQGISFLLEGVASHPTHGEVRFSIALPFSIDADDCQAGDQTDGIIVDRASETRAQITLHLDHFFIDSLVTEEPALRFEAWAAAAGEDGLVTLDDLATQPLDELRGVGGDRLLDEDGEPLFYRPGAAVLPAPNLKEYVLATGTSIPHWNGEGHCEYTRRATADEARSR